MSKKTRKGLPGSSRHYETVVVFDAQIVDDVVKGVVEKVKEILTTAGAVNITVEEWGKRKLAYPINKKTYGQYICVEYDGSGATVQLLTDYYHITETILRHLTILVDKRLIAERKREKAPPKEGAEETGREGGREGGMRSERM